MAGLEPAGTVASAVGSFMISNLVKQAFAKYDEFGKKSQQMEEAKKKLAELIVPVETVLTAVNQGQIQVPGKALDAWIWQFRDAVEEAEDVLDEIEYHKLEHEVLVGSKSSNICHMTFSSGAVGSLRDSCFSELRRDDTESQGDPTAPEENVM